MRTLTEQELEFVTDKLTEQLGRQIKEALKNATFDRGQYVEVFAEVYSHDGPGVGVKAALIPFRRSTLKVG